MLKAIPALGFVAAPHGYPVVPRVVPRAKTLPSSFPQPATVASRLVPGAASPVLAQTLDVRFADVFVPGYGKVTTRAYNGAIPGPGRSQPSARSRRSTKACAAATSARARLSAGRQAAGVPHAPLGTQWRRRK